LDGSIGQTTMVDGHYIDDIYFQNGNSVDSAKRYKVNFGGGNSTTEIYMYAPVTRVENIGDGHDLTDDTAAIALLARIRNLETIKQQ